MAQDIKLAKNTDGVYDIPISGNDFDTVDGLETAIVVSLFTDARASSGNVPEAFRRRGWCGNILTKPQNYEIGSVLWTLEQARLDQNTLNRAEDITRRAMRWLLADGIADSISVSAEKVTERVGKITIVLYKDNNETARYSTVWLATKQFRE